MPETYGGRPCLKVFVLSFSIYLLIMSFTLYLLPSKGTGRENGS
jgi:hypothetical protein